MRRLALAACLAALCTARPAFAAGYVWERVTEAAAFPPASIYTVHVAPDGRFVALHPEGTWVSRDGRDWTKTQLPWSGVNNLFLRYFQHDGASWAVGLFDKKKPVNKFPLPVDPVIQRTRDYQTWEKVGVSPTLPKVLFYGAATFQGAMWIIAGIDGNGFHLSEAGWRSTDGMNWTKAVENGPWAPCAVATAVVFKNRLFLICADGKGFERHTVWSSGDGIAWQKESDDIPNAPSAFQAIAFDDKLWLIGGDHGKEDARTILVSDDTKSWRREPGPFLPRQGVVPWTDGKHLYVAGGRLRDPSSTWPRYIQYNDVWRLRRE